jgi:hypothetical protein
MCRRPENESPAKKHLREAVPEEKFWHIASGGTGMQLSPFLNSNKKILIKGGTAWLGNQIY